MGNLVEYPLNYGEILVHWADPVRAMGWFRAADQLLRNQAILSALDAPVETKNIAANQRQASYQYGYIASILACIAHGYNMLNIVWHNDPDARQIYRTFIAGPPRIDNPGATNSPISALFAQPFDYNSAWYTRDDTFPYASAQNTRFGVLQYRAIQQCLRANAKTGDAFAISAMLLIGAASALRPGQDPNAADAIFNIPMVRTRSFQLCGSFSSDYQGGLVSLAQVGKSVLSNTAKVEVSFPWKDQCSQRKGLIERGSDGRGFRSIMPGGAILPGDFDDWRAAYHITGIDFFAEKNIVAAPLRDYLPMLQYWVTALLRRSPYQIIQDARASVVYQNAQTIRLNGSTVQQAFTAIAGTQADIESQKHRRSEEATIASGALTAAAVATSGMPVVSLILGAAAGVIAIADTLIIKGTQGHGRDDLGRYKLQFERAWLSGDPSENTLQSGAPILPASELVDPPGRGTLWSPIASCQKISERSGELSGEDDKRTNAILISGAVALTAGFGYWLTTRKS